MNCKEASNLFSQKRLGTISQANEQALEEHLNHCQSCQKAWETYSLFLSDTRIEDDFSIPSQLNAKIKYTIQQARNQKKVPFFRNKQVLSYATACCFLLVAGIWGTSHFGQIKENIHTPLLANETRMAQSEVNKTENSKQDVIVADSTTSQPEHVSNQPVEKTNPAPVQSRQLQPYLEQTEVTAPSSEAVVDQSNLNTAELATTEGQGSATEPANAATFSRQTDYNISIEEYPADMKVNTQFQAALLEGYPNTQLTDTVYRITITKAELEEILQQSVTLDEKTEFIIEFTE